MKEEIENAVATLKKHGLTITGFSCTPEVKARLENAQFISASEIKSGRGSLPPFDGVMGRGTGSVWGDTLLGIPLKLSL